ncbi:MAG TPA: hypothetical protein VGH33_14065, partial [Isosphaeraceae bacterium]
LDAISADWTRQRKCGTCHTNYAHMMARPLVKGVDAPELAEVRAGCHQCPGRKSTGGESVQCRDILDTVRRDMVDTRHGG